MPRTGAMDGTRASAFTDERHGWRQTWVDSTGNYWALEGDPHPEGFTFAVPELTRTPATS